MRLIAALVPLLSAIALSVVFWLKLWGGGGFIGGDTYTYYMPQKVWYADRLHAGEFPLWNSLAGHGYPLVAESQTGAFYPVNVGLYWMFDVNTAYSISHLLHYIGTFVIAYAFARRLRLGMIGALFAALIYTYGWFPPRACLEWAIIGGFWFVWLLWCAESYLQDGSRSWLLWLSLGLGLHLLAGHFNLAFIALLMLTVFVPARLWFAAELVEVSLLAGKRRTSAWLLGSACLGFLLATVQLWPTWELKQISVRLTPDMGFGHIPPLYLSQMFLPWEWYSPQVDTEKAIQALRAFSIDSATNKTEAHLYVGLMPWVLLISAGILRRYRGVSMRRLWVIWLGVCGLAILLVSGALLPVIRHVPGFNFFSGMGRYGMMLSLGLALFSGAALDFVAGSIDRRIVKWSLVAVCFSVAVFDLWLVNQWVSNAFQTSDPPVAYRSESDIRRVLAKVSQPVRLLAPGPNLPTLLGYSATPRYLGLAPREYFDPQLEMPDAMSDRGSIADQVAWMRTAGVTHWLRFEPLTSAWPVKPVWRGFDRVLHPAWGRSPNESLFLYELIDAPGRVRFLESSNNATVRASDYRANQVTLQASSRDGGPVVLTDLFYPGWEVTIDGQPAEAIRVEGMFRGVTVSPGEHEIVWRYRPKSVSRGVFVSLVAVVIWLTVAVQLALCRRTTGKFSQES